MFEQLVNTYRANGGRTEDVFTLGPFRSTSWFTTAEQRHISGGSDRFNAIVMGSNSAKTVDRLERVGDRAVKTDWTQVDHKAPRSRFVK